MVRLLIGQGPQNISGGRKPVADESPTICPPQPVFNIKHVWYSTTRQKLDKNCLRKKRRIHVTTNSKSCRRPVTCMPGFIRLSAAIGGDTIVGDSMKGRVPQTTPSWKVHHTSRKKDLNELSSEWMGGWVGY